MNKYIATFSFFMLSVLTATAQTTATASDDKFYVVGGVLAVIFTGIAAYLVVLDRKISKLEKQQRNKKG
jgi:CcmD family protein